MAQLPVPLEAQGYFVKAEESLAAAEAELEAKRYNVVASRAYYACFQAAVAALLVDGIRPIERPGQWSHRFVQSRFIGLLIDRRKRYSTELRRTLRDTMQRREQADYEWLGVSHQDAARIVRQAQRFVGAVREQMSWLRQQRG